MQKLFKNLSSVANLQSTAQILVVNLLWQPKSTLLFSSLTNRYMAQNVSAEQPNISCFRQFATITGWLY
jgi:hypothetical protein